MGVTTRKGVAGELSLHQNALLLPQTFPYCPGTCVCSAEVPPWSCRDPEKLSLAHLWSACGGQLEIQHRDKQAVLYPLGIPWNWHRRGSSCSTAVHLGAELGISGPELLANVLFPQCLVLPLLVFR